MLCSNTLDLWLIIISYKKQQRFISLGKEKREVGRKEDGTWSKWLWHKKPDTYILRENDKGGEWVRLWTLVKSNEGKLGNAVYERAIDRVNFTWEKKWFIKSINGLQKMGLSCNLLKPWKSFVLTHLTLLSLEPSRNGQPHLELNCISEQTSSKTQRIVTIFQ